MTMPELEELASLQEFLAGHTTEMLRELREVARHGAEVFAQTNNEFEAMLCAVNAEVLAAIEAELKLRETLN